MGVVKSWNVRLQLGRFGRSLSTALKPVISQHPRTRTSDTDTGIVAILTLLSSSSCSHSHIYSLTEMSTDKGASSPQQHNTAVYSASAVLTLAVLVGVIGGSGLYHLDNLTFVYVAAVPRLLIS